MTELILTALKNWNATKNERQKLQYALLVLTFAIVLAAGIVSLFNTDAGHTVVRLALFTFAAYVANGFVWNLLQSLIINKLTNKPRRK